MHSVTKCLLLVCLSLSLSLPSFFSFSFVCLFYYCASFVLLVLFWVSSIYPRLALNSLRSWEDLELRILSMLSQNSLFLIQKELESMHICGPCVYSWGSISPPKCESLMTSPGNDNFPWQHQTHNGLVLCAQNHRQAFCELKPSLSGMPLGLGLSLLFLLDLWEALSNWTDGTGGRQILGTSKALFLLLFLPEHTVNELWSILSKRNPTTQEFSPISVRGSRLCRKVHKQMCFVGERHRATGSCLRHLYEVALLFPAGKQACWKLIWRL